jgi:hypothetical protein
MSGQDGWHGDVKESARAGVLRFAAKSTPVADVIAQLKRDAIDEDTVRAAIWFLIGRGQIELTPDRTLALVRPAPRE